ncbi:MAG: hypothetical protein ABJN26_22650 [Stappiaceae bacterium]|uniref:hypothetical protein n=1 Tax=Roseibium sp. TaxID=1936156 RepID=UPI0032979C9E
MKVIGDTSTYELLGIPDSLAAAFVLISLSLSLVPWLGGSDIGPLKVPSISGAKNRVVAVLGPITLVAFLSGFFPFWSSNPKDGGALRVSIQSPTQVGDLLSDAPLSGEQVVFCGSVRAKLILAHSQETETPIVAHQLAIRYEHADGSLVNGKCKVDPLSLRPYGIAEVGTYLATFKESSIDVRFLENKDAAQSSQPENLLIIDGTPHVVQLNRESEPHVLDVILSTELDAPVKFWFDVVFDEKGEFATNSSEILMWK